MKKRLINYKLGILNIDRVPMSVRMPEGIKHRIITDDTEVFYEEGDSFITFNEDRVLLNEDTVFLHYANGLRLPILCIINSIDFKNRELICTRILLTGETVPKYRVGIQDIQNIVKCNGSNYSENGYYFYSTKEILSNLSGSRIQDFDVYAKFDYTLFVMCVPPFTYSKIKKRNIYKHMGYNIRPFIVTDYSVSKVESTCVCPLKGLTKTVDNRSILVSEANSSILSVKDLISKTEGLDQLYIQTENNTGVLGDNKLYGVKGIEVDYNKNRIYLEGDTCNFWHYIYDSKLSKSDVMKSLINPGVITSIENMPVSAKYNKNIFDDVINGYGKELMYYDANHIADVLYTFGSFPITYLV